MHLIRKVFIFFVLSLVATTSGWAQCAMCGAAVESSGDSIAEGLNNGILYLMIIPYLILTVIGVILYRRYKRRSLS